MSALDSGPRGTRHNVHDTVSINVFTQSSLSQEFYFILFFQFVIFMVLCDLFVTCTFLLLLSSYLGNLVSHFMNNISV